MSFVQASILKYGIVLALPAPWAPSAAFQESPQAVNIPSPQRHGQELGMSCTGMHFTLSEQRPPSRSSFSGESEVFCSVLAGPKDGVQ